MCPLRKQEDGSPAEPNEYELNSIRLDPDRLTEIRTRLSDISWWMRWLCQRIAMRAHREDGELGKFWQSRFRAVKQKERMSIVKNGCPEPTSIRAASAPPAKRRPPPTASYHRWNSPTTWCELASNFGRLFSAVAGHPQNVEAARNRRSGRRFHLTPRIRELLA